MSFLLALQAAWPKGSVPQAPGYMHGHVWLGMQVLMATQSEQLGFARAACTQVQLAALAPACFLPPASLQWLSAAPCQADPQLLVLTFSFSPPQELTVHSW